MASLDDYIMQLSNLIMDFVGDHWLKILGGGLLIVAVIVLYA